MANPPLIYIEAGKTYHVDTCKPLIKACKAGNVKLHALARGSYPGRRLGKTSLPGVSTIGYWDAVGKQDWGLEYHRNEGVELTFLETGRIPILVDNQTYLLEPGDLTITRPWQPHKVGTPYISASRLHWIIIDVGVRRPNQEWKWPKWLVLIQSDIKDLTTMLRHNEQPVWRDVNNEIRHCFKQIAKAVAENHNRNNISRITVFLNELLLLILEMLRQRGISLNPSLSSSRRSVDLFLTDLCGNLDNLSHQWSIVNMAEQCGLGVTSFIQYCKQLTNLTPTQFLNQSRVDASVKLLIEMPEMSITDIALTCGFSSSQYFATVFRRYRGCCPKRFRLKD